MLLSSTRRALGAAFLIVIPAIAASPVAADATRPDTTSVAHPVVAIDGDSTTSEADVVAPSAPVSPAPTVPTTAVATAPPVSTALPSATTVDEDASSAARVTSGGEVPADTELELHASALDPCRVGCQVADQVAHQWYLDTIGVPPFVADESGEAEVTALGQPDSSPTPIDGPDGTATSAPVVIAVLDGGVMLDHPEMGDRVRRAACAPAAPTNLMHGTAIAGLLVAGHQDGIGLEPVVAGLEVLDVPVFVDDDFETTTTASIVAAAIDCAVAEGATVINLSLSGSCDGAELLEAATRRAAAAGVSVVAAAGNDPRVGATCPADFADVVGVAALAESGDLATSSASAAIAAPGIGILTTGIHHRAPHVIVSGSSFAAPMVSAALADIARRHPAWSPERRTARLLAISDRSGPMLSLALDQGGATRPGFIVARVDGTLDAIGDAALPAGWAPATPVAGPVAWTANCTGWWAADQRGRVIAGGSGLLHGDLAPFTLAAPIVAMAATSSGHGYWLAGADGGVFAFGGAPFLGSMGGVALNAPIVDMLATPSGQGYWLLGADGGVFAFGDAAFFGTVTTTSASSLTRWGDGYGIVVPEGIISFPVLSFTPAVTGTVATDAVVEGGPVDGRIPVESIWFLTADHAVHSAAGTSSVQGSPVSAVLRATHTTMCSSDLGVSPTS